MPLFREAFNYIIIKLTNFQIESIYVFFRQKQLIFFFLSLYEKLILCDHLQMPFSHGNRVCFFSFLLMAGKYVMLSLFLLCYVLPLKKNYCYCSILEFRNAKIEVFSFLQTF